MTPEEEQGLRELQAELVGLSKSPWQPRCVAGAFHSGRADDPFIFTMQAWIDLDHAQSPFLELKIPEPEAMLPALANAFRAFGQGQASTADLTPVDAMILGDKIIDSIAQGFSMIIPMQYPNHTNAAAENDGFGGWLPILAALKSQLGFALAEALLLPVGQAYGLIAAHRRNEGWKPSGETYSTRDVPNTKFES